MPVTGRFRDSVLVLTLEGDYAFADPVRAVTDAMNDPQFRAGTALLIDARRSKTSRSSDEFRARAYWMATLVARGLSPRCAVVIGSRPHQYGLARMAAIHLDLQNMTLEIFTDFEEAMRSLTAKVAQAGGK